MTDYNDDEEQCCPTTDETLVCDSARKESSWKEKEMREPIYANFEDVFEQLEHCHYKCIGGKLELNTAYIQLKQMSNAQAATIAEQAERIAQLEAEIDGLKSGKFNAAVHTEVPDWYFEEANDEPND